MLPKPDQDVFSLSWLHIQVTKCILNTTKGVDTFQVSIQVTTCFLNMTKGADTFQVSIQVTTCFLNMTKGADTFQVSIQVTKCFLTPTNLRSVFTVVAAERPHNYNNFPVTVLNNISSIYMNIT